MAAPKIYPNNPVQRLMDTIVPRTLEEKITNPVLNKLPQIAEFGWANCTPQHRNWKVRETFGDIGAAQLVEQIGHAKRFIKEHIVAYIDGYLPTFIRRVKYALDVVKIIRYAVRIVATLNFLESVIRREIALANQWAAENIAHINYALSQVTPAGLRTAAEEAKVLVLERAKQSIQQQINENPQMTACLI
jgi:hypothetical protein